MPFRVSFFCQIQQARLGGWSENYWSSLADLSDVEAKARTLRDLLFYGKAFNVLIPNMRISDVDNFRSVKIVNFPTEPFQTPTTTGSADFVVVGGLVKLTAIPNFTVRQWYRGIFDVDVNKGGYWIPTADHTLKYNAVWAHLQSAGNGWSLRVLNRNNTKKTIQAISTAGVVTSLGHGLVTGNLVRISRVLTPKNINKVWRVVRVDADSYTLNGFATLTTAPQVGKSTCGQLQAYEYKAIATATIDRATSHKTGRPFGQLSGRRRVVRT